jgi:hypothetical protein
MLAILITLSRGHRRIISHLPINRRLVRTHLNLRTRHPGHIQDVLCRLRYNQQALSTMRGPQAAQLQDNPPIEHQQPLLLHRLLPDIPFLIPNPLPM